ncbi:MFS transporter [Labedaea rhizosphaerae]|uniref:Fucose permease n=1 Tax=Labedaea rhizosphaerae TaxID=598644 RepID=A0A4R6SGV1_LABRH|nr:fucose permease [Labedaea rhizosphaerae]
MHGAVTGSFATRVPWLQDHAGVSAGQLGLALACPAIGAALAMPVTSGLTHRFGTRATLRVLLAMWTLSLVLPSLATGLLTLCLALLVYGASSGLSDVAMNALGVEVEKRAGKSIMSGLHGMWSVGTLIGSSAGALAAHLGLNAQVHHAIAAFALTVAGLIAVRFVLDLHPEEDDVAPPPFALPPRSAILIGAVGFCAVFAEGASLDWSAVYLRDVLSASAGMAAAATAGFTVTMAVARICGDAVVNRLGAVPTVRVSGVTAAVGGVLVVIAGQPWVAMAGFALLGVGVAVVVPLAFAAAGHRGPNPGQAIAGVAAITYTAGLVAPSAVGAIAQGSSLSVSFILVTALTVGIGVFARVLR